MEADGYHARTDGFTSLAVSLGAVGVWLGFERADPIVGLAISIAIFAVLRTRRPPGVPPAHGRRRPRRSSTSIEHTAAHVDGVQRVGAVQARWVGHRLAASIAVVVDEDLTVRQGHDVAEAVRHDLLHAVRHLDDVDVHVDPCGHHGTDPHAAAGHHG